MLSGLGLRATISTCFGVLLSPSCAAPRYRRGVRVSRGQVFAVPYAYLAPWPDAMPVQKRDEAGRQARPGLPAAVLAASDRRVVIPVRRGVDSRNVAAAAAFRELTR